MTRVRGSSQPAQADDRQGEHDDLSRRPVWFAEAANDQPPYSLNARQRRMHEAGNTYAARHDDGARDEWRAPLYGRREGRPSFLDDDPSAEFTGVPQAGGASERWTLRQTYLLAALAAVLAGGGVGYAASHLDWLRMQGDKVLAMVTPRPDPAAAGSAPIHIVAATVVTKKTIATAKLEVRDVEGRVNSLIPLALTAEPAAAGQDLLLKISGLPDKAYLTAGQMQSDKVWAVPAQELKDVKLIIPEGTSSRIDLAVAAFERQSGELAAPVKTMTVALSDARIEPAAAPPPQQMASTRVTPTEASPIPDPVSTGVILPADREAAAAHVVQGDALLAAGDAEGARALYEKAWATGLAEGAVGIARSYDPLVHAEMAVNQGRPDTALALQWYERAAEAGQQAAYTAIVRLKVKP